MREKIEKALDTVRPYLQADGGDVEIVEVTGDGVVKLRLVGTCACCPMSQLTLREKVEKMLREQVPDIKAVVSL
jgi:Fe-S cluster biogenesis protein NfuA